MSKTVYRDPKGYQHMSKQAQYRFLYTERIPKNKIEYWMQKNAQDFHSYRLYVIPYIPGMIAFMTWFQFGYLGGWAGIIGCCYIFYRYLRKNYNFSERITYVRESPEKSISNIWWDHVLESLLLSFVAIALTKIATYINLFSYF